MELSSKGKNDYIGNPNENRSISSFYTFVEGKVISLVVILGVNVVLQVCTLSKRWYYKDC